ncbi:MAG: Ig-like domain-containing protein [Desulfovibrio sp.]|nr:Ig-like domain-containing protein [Desulfovibrio sp.]
MYHRFGSLRIWSLPAALVLGYFLLWPAPLPDDLISVRAAYAGDLSKSYVTDSRREFLLELDGNTLPAGEVESVTVRSGKNGRTFTLNGNRAGLISITSFSNGGDFISGNLYSTASLTAKVVDTNGSPVSEAAVTWSVISAQNNSPAMMSGWGRKKTGLTWRATPEAGLNYEELAQERIVNATNNTSTTDPSGATTMQLTDIVGERILTVKAEVTISGITYSATQDVSFGKGPLSKFTAPAEYLEYAPLLTFREAYVLCNGAGKYDSDGVDSSNWKNGDYVGGKDKDSGKMPTVDEMRAISPPSQRNGDANAQGAAYAAGWDPDAPSWWWTGEAGGALDAFFVDLYDGDAGYGLVVGSHAPVACLR